MCRSRIDRVFAVFGFFVTHLCDYRPASGIVFRQLIQMAFEMRTNLFLGFGDKAETPFVTEQATGRSDEERTGIPERT